MAASDWYYNHTTGAVDQKIKINLNIGEPDKKYWHGPYKTEALATQFYIDNKAAHPDWKEPTTNFYKQLTQGAQTDVQNATSDIFLGTNAQNWLIRIGEILLGIVLIGVGVAKLTGTTNAISSIVKARIP